MTATRLFAANVDRLLAKKEMNQSELARRLEMAPTQVSRILRGTNTSLEMLDRFAAALEASPAELLMSEGELRDRGHDIRECVRRVMDSAMKNEGYVVEEPAFSKVADAPRPPEKPKKK